MNFNRTVRTYLKPLLLKFHRPINRPLSIMFDISPGCFLKCQHCDIWRNKPEAPISLKQAQTFIGNIYDWLGPHYLFFTGGEPMMNPHLSEIIAYCTQKKISTHLNTNAYMIDDRTAKKLAGSGLSAVSISLDGATAITHDSIRGQEGVYDRVIKAIKLLQKHQSGSALPKIYINTVIMKPNLNELEDLVRLSKKLKTDGINFQYLLPNFGDIHPKKERKELWPEIYQLEAVMERLKDLTSTDKHILHPPVFFDTAIKYYSDPKYLNSTPCSAGINNFIFNHTGDVRLCFQFPKIGNLFDETAKEIWNGKIAQKQREHILKCKQACKIIACNRFD